MISFKVEPKFGSNLTSLKFNGRELIYCDRKLLTAHDFTGNFVLWPFPNRVRNREYVFLGKRYSLKKVIVPRGNFPLIHGLVRDENWQSRKIKNGLKTWIEIDESFKYWDCWPFRSRLELEYKQKKNSLKISYRVKNLGEQELGFGFGLHPMFKDAVAIKIPFRQAMEADQELLPSGRLLKADYNRKTAVSELNLDQVFFNKIKGEWPEVWFKNGLKLRIKTSADLTHCVVYTGEKDKFTCVESQTCSTDCHNLDNLGFKKQAHLLRVKPGASRKGWIEYEVSKG